MLALAGSAAGIALISPAGDVLESTWIGWRLLLPALVLLGLAASVFRIPRHRDLATIMWALGAVALLGSEWLVVRDATWRAVVFAITAAVLGLLSRLLREQRLWLAGWIVACGTAFATIVVLTGDLGDRRRRADALRDRGARGRGRPRRPLRARLGRQGAPRSRHGRLGDRASSP